MARPSVDGLPPILLSCASHPDRNVHVTSAYARKHEKLVTLARRKYGKDYPEESFGIHFHHTCDDIAEDHCDAEIDDFLYDEGEYFEHPFVQEDGRLKLFAHFVATNADNVAGSRYRSAIKIEDSPRLEPQMPPQLVTPPVLDDENHGSARIRDAGHTPRASDARNEAAEVVSSRRDRSMHTGPAESMVSISPASSRENDQPPRDEESQTGSSGRAPSTQATPTTPLAGRYPAMPAEATLRRLLDALNDPDQTTSSRVTGDRRRIIHKYRRIAHAELIDGVYGIEAGDPCERCKRKGRACRVYHPDAIAMYARVDRLNTDRTQFYLGTRCSGCRVDKAGGKARCDAFLWEQS